VTDSGPLEVLRLIYKHLDMARLLNENPSLNKSDVDAVFTRFATHLKDTAPAAPSTPHSGAHQTQVPGRGMLVINCDGASRGNPGSAGAGVVIADAHGKTIGTRSVYLGRATNNFAEYSAAIVGLQEALSLGADDILLRADSELLVKQLRGEYRVRSATLAKLHAQARGLLGKFKRVRLEHIPREQNAAADELATAAADTRASA
jgi:ribonuclease HI